MLHRSALAILLVFLMSSNNCNSFSLFNPLTRADGLYFLITFLMLATLMVVDPEYELKGSICKDPITLQTRHCFGLLLTTSNHLSY